MRVPLVLALVAAPTLWGCGPDCQSTCDRLFGDGTDQCEIVVPQVSSQEMTRECVAHCQQALARNGDIGTYDPDERSSGNDDVTLDNEKQAALWMDCVGETSCEYLNDGYCAPVKNYPAN